ncbi:hypothetical protein Tco_0332683 [Tanacetum coccineum]
MSVLRQHHSRHFMVESADHLSVEPKLEIKRGKLNPWYIGPFKILKRVGPVAYTLELPKELSSVHSIFYISNLKKCLSDESLIILMKELRLDDTLNFVEELVEIMNREVKQLRQSHIPIVKVRWNSKRGPEFTWERKDQIRTKTTNISKTKDWRKGKNLVPSNSTQYMESIWHNSHEIDTLANGTQQLVASIDSKEYTITEASVRSKLQLADATGIHNLSDAEIYAGISHMGLRSLEKEDEGHQTDLRNLQAGGEYEDKDEDIRRSPYNDKDTEDIRRYS